MAVVYSSMLKNNRMQLVADLIAGKVAASSSPSKVSAKKCAQGSASSLRAS